MKTQSGHAVLLFGTVTALQVADTHLCSVTDLTCIRTCVALVEYGVSSVKKQEICKVWLHILLSQKRKRERGVGER